MVEQPPPPPGQDPVPLSGPFPGQGQFNTQYGNPAQLGTGLTNPGGFGQAPNEAPPSYESVTQYSTNTTFGGVFSYNDPSVIQTRK